LILQAAANIMRAMSRNLAGTTALLVLLAGAVRAQELPPPPPLPFLPSERVERENALQQEQAERQYRAAVDGAIRDKKASNDPWHNVRTAQPYPVLDRHRPE
jgi:hypothetical protein